MKYLGIDFGVKVGFAVSDDTARWFSTCNFKQWKTLEEVKK